MNNFFATPTDVWGDDAVTLTTAGIVLTIAVILALIALALLVYRRTSGAKNGKLSTRQLVFSAAAIALAMVTSMIKVLDMPLGGSATLLSMLFITLIGYWYGPTVGITTGMAYGLLQFVIEPVFYTIPQMLTDYPLAFGALGLAGFLCNKKYGLFTGYLLGVAGRFVFTVLSGALFFAAYAPDSMNPLLYSFLYNGAYLLAEALLTLIVLAIPPVNKALAYIKRMAVTQ